jgi:hypothetical protein
MSIVALPAMLRFLNWTVGSVQNSGGGSLSMLAAAGAAGIHGTASLRGVTDHARDMERRYTSPGPASPPAGGASGSGTGTPTVSPPAYTGPPAGTSPAPAAASAGTAATTAPAGGTAATAGTGAAAGGSATTTAAAASGPAAPVVAGAAVVGQTTVGTVKKAADSSAQDGAR